MSLSCFCLHLPWMSQCFTARVTLVCVNTHQLLYEVFCRIANVVPVRRIEFKFTCNNNKGTRKIRFRFSRCFQARKCPQYHEIVVSRINETIHKLFILISENPWQIQWIFFRDFRTLGRKFNFLIFLEHFNPTLEWNHIELFI